MIACTLKLKRCTVNITPEMAYQLIQLGLIQVVKLGHFKSVVEDDLDVWKYLRA